jgi:uncharacterized membrane-anchored protein YhcB (DUF1043 family)
MTVESILITLLVGIIIGMIIQSAINRPNITRL